MIIKPKNWQDFQHYKDRCPPWIKLHRSILDNYEFHQMQDASKSLAMCLWLVASEHLDGEIDASYEKLAFRFRSTPEKIEKALNPLIDNGFFFVVRNDSELLAACKPDAPLGEERRDRGETEAEAERGKKTEKATRLPTDWTMPPEYGNWALDERPEWDNDRVLKVAADFKDYWVAKAGKDGAKLDWLATWRRWVRNTK